MTVPADSHNRGRISESAAKGCVAASCVALMALGFVSLAWPSESPLSSARSQSTGFSSRAPGVPHRAGLAAHLPHRRGGGSSSLPHARGVIASY